MHWSPEHSQSLTQWPEQHLDVSSSTSPPARKPDLCPGRSHTHSYAWANDDISALTASNLLKRYAEKYSSAMDSSYGSPPMCVYPEPGTFGGPNGQKVEPEPWILAHSTEGEFSLMTSHGHEGMTGTKGGSIRIAENSFSNPGYSSSSSTNGLPSHDYPSTYSGAYLSSGYCTQPTSALAPPSLHALQPASPLVPSYSSPSHIYNYPHQATLTPAYTNPSTPYLPSGLPTHMPSRPSIVAASYSYQNPNPGELELSSSMKRKAFEITSQNDEGDDSHYRKYGYEQVHPDSGSPYNTGDKSDCRGNDLTTPNTNPQTFKPVKTPSQPSGVGDELGKYNELKPLISPSYGGPGEYSPPTGLTGENGGGKHSLLSQTMPTEPIECTDQQLMKVVNEELLDRRPAPPWTELLGHSNLKATLEKDILWPGLQPGPARPLHQTILLFGPQGGGKTTLARSMASQLGAAFFQLSGATLASRWKGISNKLLRVLFMALNTRQHCVVFLSQAEILVDLGLQQHLVAHMEVVQQGTGGTGLLICATSRPDQLDEALHRSFAKCYYVGLPDTDARRQMLLQVPSPRGCGLNERELVALLHHTEGFSIHKLLQLCQHAAASANASASPHSPPGHLPPLAFKDFENALRKVQPHATPKDQDTCMQWGGVSSH